MNLPAAATESPAAGRRKSTSRERTESASAAASPPVLLKPVLRGDRPATGSELQEQTDWVRGGERFRPLALIAEPDPDRCRAACQHLEAVGFAIELADSSQQILPRFDALRPDLLVVTAGLGFLELCAAIRKLPWGQYTPLVSVTGPEAGPSAQDAYAAGVTDLVAEPVNWLVVAKRLRRWVEAERYRQAALGIDHFSGLLTRATFESTLERLLGVVQRSGGQLALLYLNVDELHRTDDLDARTLQTLFNKIADRLGGCLRRGDLIGCNDRAGAGGGEVLIALSNLSKVESAARAAQRILETLGPAFVLRDRAIYVSAHLGIALLPRDGDTASSLVQSAFRALGAAGRQDGPSYRFHDEQLNTIAHQNLVLEEQLRNALRDQEFYLLYQPLVDCRTLKVVGVESLLRWEHTERGTLLPAYFIQAAEDAGLAQSIGEWVCRSACRQLRKWLDQGIAPIRLSINVSNHQLRSGDFVGLVKSILAETEFDPQLLRLDMSQRTLLEHHPQVEERLLQLKRLGVQLAVDCNGSGSVSLHDLSGLPLDVVQLNRSRLRDEGHQPAGSTPDLAALIAVAHQLALEVVAKGVKSAAQLRLLRQQECDEVQGFLFSLPLTAAEIGRLLTATNGPSATWVA